MTPAEQEAKWAAQRKAQEERWAYEASPKGQIELARKAAAEKLVEAERLEKLSALYPDLRRFVGRWEKVVWCSKAVNAQATEYDRRFNCGCCSDSPLEIWPYLETEFGKVYSDPPEFKLGEKHWISGAKPYAGWKDKLREAGIREEIIEGVQAYFGACHEERVKLAEEDSEAVRLEDADDGP